MLFRTLTIALFVSAVSPSAASAETPQAPLAVETAVSRDLADRIMRVREIALATQSGPVIRRLDQAHREYRMRSGRVPESVVSGLLGEAEAALGLDAVTDGEGDPYAWLPHRMWPDISYEADDRKTDPFRTLDIYAPQDAANAPVVVWIHGGGLRGGGKAHPGVTLLKPDFFMSLGLIFVSVNYRLLPDHAYPDFVNDVADALVWLDGNVGRFGGDPAKLILIGHSAGAHIASLLATNEEFLETRGVSRDLIKSVISLDIASYDIARRLSENRDLRASSVYLRALGEDPIQWSHASPSRNVTPGEALPPFLVVHAGAHREAELVEVESRKFHNVLSTAGTASTLFRAERRTHIGLNLQIGVRGDPTTDAIIVFLKDHEMIGRRYE
ncbi:MAG: alpha/beta hydrolase [Alphaproteobacteria bacterium]|nr:alpha/beta hydrolase [Alphaproteobacteria bacterium]